VAGGLRGAAHLLPDLSLPRKSNVSGGSPLVAAWLSSGLIVVVARDLAVRPTGRSLLKLLFSWQVLYACILTSRGAIKQQACLLSEGPRVTGAWQNQYVAPERQLLQYTCSGGGNACSSTPLSGRSFLGSPPVHCYTPGLERQTV